MSNSNEWYLRAGEEIFGPETMERLVEWVKVGRIMPGQEISCDHEKWYPVVEVPFLDMRWSIDIGDGNPRGPFHHDAAEALVKSGRLPEGAKVVEVRPPFEDFQFPPEEGNGEDVSGGPAPVVESTVAEVEDLKVEPVADEVTPDPVVEEGNGEPGTGNGESSSAEATEDKTEVKAGNGERGTGNGTLEFIEDELPLGPAPVEEGNGESSSAEDSSFAEATEDKPGTGNGESGTGNGESSSAEASSFAEATEDKTEVKTGNGELFSDGPAPEQLASQPDALALPEQPVQIAAVVAEKTVDMARLHELETALAASKGSLYDATRALEESRKSMDSIRAECDARVAAAEKSAAAIKAECEAKLVEMTKALESVKADCSEKLAAAAKQLAEDRKAIEEANELSARRQEAERAVLDKTMASLNDANARAEAAAAKVAASEREYSELLAQFNQRESEYQARINNLTESLKQVPPDAAAAAAATGAIFELMQVEAEDLAHTLEIEKREAEAVRQAWMKREDRLLTRRQELLRRIGDGPSNMLMRAIGARPADPTAVRMRDELDKVKHEYENYEAETKQRIRELTERADRFETENLRLRPLAVDAMQSAAQIRQLREDVARREKELTDLRQVIAEERKQQAAANAALMNRLSQLEDESLPGTMVSEPVARPKTSRFPGWMQLKK